MVKGSEVNVKVVKGRQARGSEISPLGVRGLCGPGHGATGSQCGERSLRNRGNVPSQQHQEQQVIVLTWWSKLKIVIVENSNVQVIHINTLQTYRQAYISASVTQL